jgi:hypothetical protein
VLKIRKFNDYVFAILELIVETNFITTKKMTELKQLDIAHQFCKLLQLGNTGSREELAQQLGITPRWVTVYKRKIEKIYKVKIHYHRKSRNFYLSETDQAKLPPPT